MAKIIDHALVSYRSEQGEAALVAQVKAGDQTACAKLVALFGPQMKAVTRRFMRCDDDCNDALQDAFTSAFKALERFEATSRLSTWLHRITVNSCLMKLRKSSMYRETSIEEMLPSMDRYDRCADRFPSMNDSAAEVESEEMCTVVRRAIDRLPDADRTVLLLRDIEEMDTAATASILKMTEHNVKRRLYRARQTLHALLKPMIAGEGVVLA